MTCQIWRLRYADVVLTHAGLARTRLLIDFQEKILDEY